MLKLDPQVKDYIGRNTIACPFRRIAAALVQKHGLPADPDRILFLLDRVKGRAYSGSTISPMPAMWREVLFQLTGHEFDYLVKLYEPNTAALAPKQVTALLYHELRHIKWDPEKETTFFDPHHDMEDWQELVPFGDWEADPSSLPDLMCPEAERVRAEAPTGTAGAAGV